jgi:hypothetical protein
MKIKDLTKNGADGGLLMFDVNNYRTMIDLLEWLSIWRENTPQGLPYY